LLSLERRLEEALPEEPLDLVLAATDLRLGRIGIAETALEELTWWCTNSKVSSHGVAARRLA